MTFDEKRFEKRYTVSGQREFDQRIARVYERALENEKKGLTQDIEEFQKWLMENYHLRMLQLLHLMGVGQDEARLNPYIMEVNEKREGQEQGSNSRDGTNMIQHFLKLGNHCCQRVPGNLDHP